jgi:hypothetical protein
MVEMMSDDVSPERCSQLRFLKEKRVPDISFLAPFLL